jgi:GTP-binding protein SAR1
MGVHEPTLHPNSEELIIGQIKFRTFDLGGHEPARKLWRDYFPSVDGVVYLCDAADRERFPEASRELNSLLSGEELADVPFLILGNKIDMDNAASEAELREALGLLGTTTGTEKIDRASGVRPIELFMCSVALRAGYVDGFRWLAQYLSDAK